jgi:bacterioferritin-associated ferredoxin
MDVSEKDIKEAIKQGFDYIETLKRFTGVCMGPCQGKLCMMHTVEILARELGKTPAEVYVPTVRPPIKPVFLGALAEANVQKS